MSPVSIGKRTGPVDRPLRASSARKRRAILDATVALFLRQGYIETTLDEIAALAGVSKQTIYSHFPDKERLFLATIAATTERAGAFVDDLVAGLAETDDLDRDLRALARRWLLTLLDPDVVAFRRLVIAESRRFPQPAATYYESAPGRVLAAVAGALRRLAARGILAVDDAELAAQHLAWLVLAPIDRAMFLGERHGVSRDRAITIAEAGVTAFLAAYRPRPAGSVGA